ncbi:hypothetical protein [Nodularia sp. NIES-3585]|uniref:hypothetical protein n=1 Tax=Nodularia sp. NIES-3585 TaxID=1973477 RepID=UPI000B5C83AA|nr:hypothetical protein [Nodularia sp. NIES-3585]GAX36935.1 hypothetical protein NIES3585_29740 [Nodularia sp. NIES-3585]
MDSSSSIIEFCQLVRDRSTEHQEAVNLLLENGIIGVAVGLLRQEIDSFIRVSHVFSTIHAISEKAQDLIADFMSGKKWPVNDGEMLRNEGGWVKLIYQLSCNLIHLSNYHSYNRNDPFVNLVDSNTKTEIINYLNHKHGYPDNTISKEQFIPYISKILAKIVSNTDYHLKEIEKYASQQVSN